MSYLALLCRREHQFEGPGVAKGSMWGLEVCRPEIPFGPLWQRAVAPKEELIDQILHHPALAAAGMRHPGLGCWRPGSSWAAWADALLLGLGFWKAGLAVVSHARRSEEVGGYIANCLLLPVLLSDDNGVHPC